MRIVHSAIRFVDGVRADYPGWAANTDRSSIYRRSLASEWWLDGQVTRLPKFTRADSNIAFTVRKSTIPKIGVLSQLQWPSGVWHVHCCTI